MGSEVCADEQVICGSWSLICKTGDEEEAGPATPEEKAEHSPPHSSPDVETPKETLFDSFAPGSDKLLLAPRRHKYMEESRSHVVRRLDFASSLLEAFNNADDDDNDDEDEEQRLYEIVYGTIMDAISAEKGSPPRSTPLLTGIAETCPAAPIKSGATKHRFIIDKDICKKLQF